MISPHKTEEVHNVRVEKFYDSTSLKEYHQFTIIFKIVASTHVTHSKGENFNFYRYRRVGKFAVCQYDNHKMIHPDLNSITDGNNI